MGIVLLRIKFLQHACGYFTSKLYRLWKTPCFNSKATKLICLWGLILRFEVILKSLFREVVLCSTLFLLRYVFNKIGVILIRFVTYLSELILFGRNSEDYTSLISGNSLRACFKNLRTVSSSIDIPECKTMSLKISEAFISPFKTESYP